MEYILTVVLIVGFGLFLATSIRRSTELFVLRVNPDGVPPVKFVRGRIPGALLQDLRGILVASGARGTLRVLLERGAAVVDARGSFSPDTMQRVRNLVGLHPLAKLRNGLRPDQS